MDLGKTADLVMYLVLSWTTRQSLAFSDNLNAACLRGGQNQNFFA